MHIFPKHWNSSSLRDICAVYVCFFLCFPDYLSLSPFPPNPREAGEIWFANNQRHWYCWTVEVAAHGAMWMARQVKSILPWAITCPAAIGCWVILLTMLEEHYISHSKRGSVIKALAALWRSVLPAGVPNGNKHDVLTTRDKSSKLQIGCNPMQGESQITRTLSRLNMRLFSTVSSIPVCPKMFTSRTYWTLLAKILLNSHLYQTSFWSKLWIPEILI